MKKMLLSYHVVHYDTPRDCSLTLHTLQSTPGILCLSQERWLDSRPAYVR